MRRLRREVVAGASLAAIALVQGMAGVGSVALAASSTLYVDRNVLTCNDSGPGTLSVPYCTIGAAAAVATPGTSVVVNSSGTYPEDVRVTHSGTQGAPITFAPASGASVTISGQTHGFWVANQSWITISGFNIMNTSNYGIYLDHSADIIVDSNHVSYTGMPLSGQTAAGIHLSTTTDSLIENNTVDHTTWAGIELYADSVRVEVRHNLIFSNAAQWERAAVGIDVESAFDTVDYNIAHDNEDSGIQFYKGVTGTGGDNGIAFDNVSYNNGDHGIDNHNVTGGALTGNTVYHNCTTGINVESTLGSTPGSITIENNIAVDNAYNGNPCGRGTGNIGVSSLVSATTTADYNLVNLGSHLYVWAGVSYSSITALHAATGQEAHGIGADPMWVNPAGADFHLQAGSPAIDSANAGAPSEPSTDMDGKPRVDDPATLNTGAGPRDYDDRGAYEFQPTVSDTVPPSVPPGLAATASSSQPLQVHLSWNASKDNVGVTGYTVYRGGIVIAEVLSGTAYTDTAVVDGTTYTYAVDAFDASGNHSAQSGPVTVTTPDVTPPSVPTGVTATALTARQVNVSWNASTDNVGVTGYDIYRNGSSTPLATVDGSTLTYADNTVASLTSYSYTVDAFDAAGNHSAQSAPASLITPGSTSYTAVTPVRLLDTRNNGTTLGSGGSLNLAIGGVGQVPANATAVVINVTAVDQSAPGFFTVYPTGVARPTASNLNFVANQTVPNLVTVGLGGGSITIYNGVGTADAVVDLEGYYAPSSGTSAGEYVPVVPARITDTRPGSGQPNSGLTLGPLANLNVQVTGMGGIPATGVGAVILNVTATNTTAAGFFTAFPTGASLPVASNLNWSAGETVPNRVIVPVGSGGMVSFHNGMGNADLIVDVGGYFTDSTRVGGSFSALVPSRIVDTRNGTGGFSSPVGQGQTIVVTVAANGGVPAMTSANPPSAVVLNVTVDGATAASDLTVWPDGATAPVASDLNFSRGQTVANLVIVKLSPDGKVDIRNDFGSTNVIVDVVGWYG